MGPESGDAAVARFLRETARILHLRLDAEGRVLSANAFALDVLGPDIVGRPFPDLLVSFTNPLDPVRAARLETVPSRATCNTREGLPRNFSFSFFQEDGTIHAFGETDEEDAQALLKTLIDTNNELSDMARQLQKSNVALQRLDAVKNQFLGMAAHDLRNPISAIIAYSEYVRDEAAGLGKEQKEFLNIIERSSRYMLALLDDLLDIARIESGKLGLDLVETDFLGLLRDNLKLNAALADKKGIRLDVLVQGTIPRLVIDPLKIEQVLNNLLSNALKFSAPGTTVQVRVSQSDGHVTVEVRDQGPGIARDKLDRIFQPFYRGEKQGTAGERCTGLGLAIVQKIVNGHRGRIWVESREGQGSGFFFTLPVPDDRVNTPKEPK